MKKSSLIDYDAPNFTQVGQYVERNSVSDPNDQKQAIKPGQIGKIVFIYNNTIDVRFENKTLPVRYDTDEAKIYLVRLTDYTPKKSQCSDYTQPSSKYGPDGCFVAGGLDHYIHPDLKDRLVKKAKTIYEQWKANEPI